MKYGNHPAARFVLAISLLFEVSAVRTQAQQYTFTPVDYFSGPFQGFSSRPTLNNSGVLAYRAIRTNSSQGIYSGSGGPVTLISTPPPAAAYSSFNDGPSINDSGIVLFRSGVSNGNNGVFVGNGGPVSYLYSDTDLFPFNTFGANPSINNSGRMGSQARMDAGGTAIMSGDGGLPATVATSADPSFGFGQNPDINNFGIVAFQALDLSQNPTAIQQGSGGPLTTLISIGGSILSVDSPSINDADVVIFREFLNGGDQLVAYSSDGVFIKPFADTLGPLDSFGLDGSLDINDTDEIAFFGHLDNGQQGIFTGADLSTDYVIRSGDPLDGSFVLTLGFFRGGLTDKGQIAFYATLLDGRAGVFRADPIVPTGTPEPGPMVLLASAGIVMGLSISRRIGATR